MGGEQTKGKPAGMAGLYIHIPFCLQKCPYCDFYSITDRSRIPAFVRALKREMSLIHLTPIQFDSLYLGGGTPSVLQPQEVGDIIQTVHTYFDIVPACETTIEINPGTVKSKNLKDYKKMGINRINIGVQSFQAKNLKFLGRIHSAQDAADTLKEVQKAGFNNIGLDLIYCIPGQTKSSWLDDLERAVAFEPQHLACYMLTYEQGTPMDRDRQEGCFQPVDGNKAAELFQITTEFLSARGYQHYEISNFATSVALRSRHNQKYWSYAPYIGLGPAAHSFIPPIRSWNHADVDQFIGELAAGRLPVSGREELTEEQQMIEAVYLGLRKTDGIDLDLFESRFNANFCQLFENELKRFEEKGYLHITQNRCALTLKGMLFQDSITAALTSIDLT